MATNEKTGGGGLTAIVLIGVVGFGAFKYHEAKEDKRKLAEALATLPQQLAERDKLFNDMAAATCFAQLGGCSTGGCPVSPSTCPVDESCRILRQRGARAESRDLAHDILLEVCTHADSEHDQTTWRNQMYFRANRRASSHLRRWNRNQPIEAAPALPEDDPIAERDDAEAAHAAIHAALARLDPIDKCMMEKRELAGQSYAAAAEACGVASEQAARARVSRAMATLRTLIPKVE